MSSVKSRNVKLKGGIPIAPGFPAPERLTETTSGCSPNSDEGQGDKTGKGAGPGHGRGCGRGTSLSQFPQVRLQTQPPCRGSSRCASVEEETGRVSSGHQGTKGK